MDGREAIDGRLTPMVERRLIERAQQGCAQSAHALVTAHQDRLHAFVWRMVRDNHDAEEICQDAFLRAFQALDKFNFAYRFSTWLFTIGYRLCLNAMRRRRKDYSGDFDFGSMPAKTSDDAPAEVGEAVAHSDEARRLKRIIWESVDQLTPQQRATVTLFYRESLGCQEIGEILSMPAATVKSHLHRARKRLRELLSSELADDWSMVRMVGTGGAA
jgi:RNA polymerase sigma-70 factor (ECF subfamily)